MLRIWGVVLAGFLAAGLSLGLASGAEGAANVKVCGSGNGHGVGLSQYGAYGRAEAGQGYARILKSYYRGISVEKFSSNPKVRVLLGSKSFSGSHDVVVRRGSRARLKNRATGGAISLRPARYRVKYLPKKKLYRVTNVSRRKAVGSFRGPLFFRPVSGGPLRYGKTDYRGRLQARVSGPKLYLINHLSLETYIRGVVPDEMPASWHPQALKSQAVAARSYARATRRAGPFDFYADTRSQVYGGASAETRATNRAVRATARVHATYNGKAVTAFFHSSSGGHTESSSHVFGRSPYLEAARDRDARGKSFEARVGSPWRNWRGTLDPGGSRKLGVGELRRVRVLSRSRSGRALKVEVRGSRGKKTVSGQYDIRYAFETNGLRRADGSRYPAGSLPSARVKFGSACS